MPMSEEELAGLSETERAALEDGGDDEKDLLQAVAGSGDDGDADDAAEDAEDEAGNDSDNERDDARPESAHQDNIPPKKDEPVVVEADYDDEQPSVLPTLPVEMSIEDANKALADAKAERRNLLTKYNSGELSDEQYQDALDKLDDSSDKARAAISAADMNARIVQANQQAEEQAWKRTVTSFMERTKTSDGIDYRGNALLNAALDTAVRSLANAKDEQGNLIHADKPSGWFLAEGHKQVKESFGLVVVPKSQTQEKAAVNKPARAPGKTPDLSGLPPAISRAPQAAASDDGGEFAHLENLSGMELERALARMTPEQQDRYAQA